MSLAHILKLSCIDKDLYSSVNLYKFEGARAVFGGQVLPEITN